MKGEHACKFNKQILKMNPIKLSLESQFTATFLSFFFLHRKNLKKTLYNF